LPAGDGEREGLIVLRGRTVVLAVAVGEVRGFDELPVYEALESCAQGGNGPDMHLNGAALGQVYLEGWRVAKLRVQVSLKETVRRPRLAYAAPFLDDELVLLRPFPALGRHGSQTAETRGTREESRRVATAKVNPAHPPERSELPIRSSSFDAEALLSSPSSRGKAR